MSTPFALAGFLFSSAAITHADQLILDDLIVDGAICAGGDCVNGESFGFDSLRLKENNVRIRAVDTSTSASFPTRDWQITFNDTANGGQNKFSIDDIDGGRTPFTIEASAPSHSLYVDDGGRIGLGTSAPVVEVHVVDGDTPTVRLEQDGSSGFTPQTWDLAGNETNFFIRDVTNGSKLPFRVRPGAPSSSIDVTADGNIGMGTSSPGNPGWGIYKVHMKAKTGQHGFVAIDSDSDKANAVSFLSAGVAKWHLSNRNEFQSSGDKFVFYNEGNDEVITMLQNKNVGFSVAVPTFPIEHSSGARLENGNWTNASSREYKQDIIKLKLNDANDALMKLDPVRYSYKTNPTEEYIGFIAEDVPSLVATSDRKGLTPMDIVAVLTKVVQDQQKNINILSKNINNLEEKVKKINTNSL